MPTQTHPPEIGRESALREMLARTIESGIVTQLSHDPDLAIESNHAASAVRQATGEREFAKAQADLKSVLYKLEIRSRDGAAVREALLRLFGLMLDNVSQLVDDDRWLHGQIGVVREILSGDLTRRRLDEAEKRLKEIVFRQGGVKQSLGEAKAALKQMIAVFVERLAELAASTGDYRDKLEGYAQKITHADGIVEIGKLVDEIVDETRVLSAAAQKSQQEIERTRREALDAENRIRSLENELEQMSVLVQQDALTGSLNRRGLEDAFVRESARADRRDSPLSLVLVDLDDFKVLNDRHGHQAGDRALAHLVRVIRDTVRPNDLVARFGGEEFAILLPDTRAPEAMVAVRRLQRELAKRPFVHADQSIAITFSAGVAERESGEEQGSVLVRADRAMYRAKSEGKDRACEAERPIAADPASRV